MSDTFGVAGAVEVNGVNYGDLGAVSPPAPGTWSSPKTGSVTGAITATVGTLWGILAVEIVLLILGRRWLRNAHGG